MLPSLSPHQREQLTLATAGPIGLLGGGPGTGKTYTVAALISHLADRMGLDEIVVGAPTGKAAVRITECLQQPPFNVPLRARTWHSILAGGPSGNFTFNERCPLPYRVIIGDETSMVDCSMIASILRARPRGTLVLLVGDVHQLPPVGSGAPLRDLIAAGLPYGELKEIKRNSGGIVEACAAIRDGQRWQPGDNLTLVETSNSDEQISRLQDVLRDCPPGVDPVWDYQILVPLNDKSAISRKALNGILQAQLNPAGKQAGKNPFRHGDKIVNLRNGYFPSIDYDESDPDVQTDDRDQVYVANGEIGRVLDVQEFLTIVDLKNPARTIKVPRAAGGGNGVDSDSEPGGSPSGDSDKSSAGCTWDLAYALSVHKSQGSEFRRVVVMLDEYPGAKMVCDRSWLYTSISRAKEHCLLMGKRSIADEMAKKNRIWTRKTFLRERILRERGKLELDGI